MFSEKLIKYYKQLKPPTNLPKGIELLFPQKDPQVIEIVKKFFEKYYNDDHSRRLMLGINPGRFGAGITGVNFTGPKQLKEECAIDHHLKLSSELSAEFIYEMINAYGGVKTFYQNWFIGAVCPLGFVTKPTPTILKQKDTTRSPSGGGVTSPGTPSAHHPLQRGIGKNINYYDDKRLQQAVTPFIIDCINKLVAIGFNTDKCLCIGGEKNFKFLSGLNNEHQWFREIVPLPHPRFILQYCRKQKDQYIQQYLSALRFD